MPDDPLPEDPLPETGAAEPQPAAQRGRRPGTGAGARSPDAAAPPAAASPPEAARPPDGPPDAVLLNDRYEIFPVQPLPELAGPDTAAVAARDRRDANIELSAHVCRGNAPPRWDIAGSLSGIDNPALIRLIGYGVVAWPSDKAERPVMVFERPRGTRLFKSVKHKREPMPEELLTRGVIQPLAAALAELRLRRLFHGAVNPMTLFLRDSDGSAKVQLGECVTLPAGAGQLPAFETIERGMAQPLGRGPGTGADDLYALGVTILALLLGAMPGRGLDDQALLNEKIDKGSFTALIGDARLPLTVLEPVRGLLLDDPASRWSLEDLELWLAGRRLSPRQAQAPKRGSRPFPFKGQELWTARTVAAAMAARTGDANEVIETGDLVHWIRRSLDDELLVNKVEDAVSSARAGRGGPIEERRVARVVMALDPPAPVRYRGKAVMPAGLGAVLGEVVARGGTAQEYAEIIAGQLPMSWVNSQPEFRADFVALTGTFDHARSYLERPAIGNGLERCVYELSPNTPCLSPILQGHYVLDLEGLMWALEEVAGAAERPAAPVDRHVAAFVLSRNPKVSDRLLQALASDQQRPEYGLAVTGLLFELQKATRAHPLPALCGWAADLLEPAIERFHSRTLRRRVREAMDREAETGLFKNIYTIANNGNLIRRDQAAFRAASRDYVTAMRAITQRQEVLANRARLTEDSGRQMAALCSGVLSAVLVVVLVILSAA